MKWLEGRGRSRENRIRAIERGGSKRVHPLPWYPARDISHVSVKFIHTSKQYNQTSRSKVIILQDA
jgi:hypothetical protein